MILPETGRGTAAGGGGGVSLRKPTTVLARKLRRKMSYPEVILWQELRGKKQGFKVRRQHPLGNYVADFFAAEARLVIEIDGQAHDAPERSKYDAKRDDWLKEQGFRVLRIAARDVLNDMEAVVNMIVHEVKNPLHHPADGPPPRDGEDACG